MSTLEEECYHLYLKLRTGLSCSLFPEQYQLLSDIGLKLQETASGHTLIDRHSYHPPYELDSLSRSMSIPIELYGIIPTTLDKHPPQIPALIIADGQTAGRGRYQRQWYSPVGRQILLTYHLSSHEFPRPYDGLWALWRLLRDYGAVFKWPNDLYHPSGKIAGFLIQSQGPNHTLSFGLNCSTPSQWPIGSLGLGPEKICRMKLISQWFEQLNQAATHSQEEIVADLMKTSMIVEGEEVFFEEKIYLFKGLSDDGLAILQPQKGGKRRFIGSGSLRPTDPLGWVFQQTVSNSCPGG